MEELELKGRELVLNNVKSEINNDVLEMIIISVMALVLRHGEIAYSRLPEILNDLDIIADNKSLLEISHEKLDNYSEDELLGHTDIAVTRSLYQNDENSPIEEKKTLIISLLSLNKNKLILFIEKLVHEFTHLMRFGGITDSENKIVIKDGISINTFNKQTSKVKRKHYFFEEGITQYYTIQCLDNLYEFLSKSSCSSNQFLTTFKNKYSDYEFSAYVLQVEILKILCQDSRFEELLNYTFEETTSPSQLALYYNSVMDSNSAFTKFSKLIDSCLDSRFDEDPQLENTFDLLSSEKKSFLYNAISKQKRFL